MALSIFNRTPAPVAPQETTAKTRFNTMDNFLFLDITLDRLKKKEEDLKKAVDLTIKQRQAGKEVPITLEEIKWNILSPVWNKINESITKFNNISSLDEESELEQQFEVLTNIGLSINNLIFEDLRSVKMLNKPRRYDKAALHMLYMSSVFAAMIATYPYSVPAMLVSGIISDQILANLCKLSGISLLTASIDILVTIQLEVVKLLKNYENIPIQQSVFQNYYNILNLESNASAHEIKESYKKLVLTCHPDKNRDKDIETKNKLTNQFYDVQKAFTILSHPVKKALYDQKYHQELLRKDDHLSIRL